MSRTSLSRLLPVCAAALCAAAVSAGAATIQHIEDFSTNAYKHSTLTTAWWNTSAGELTLFPFEPALVGSYLTPAAANAVQIGGNTAFIAGGSAGLIVLDVSTPAAPTLLGAYDTPGDALDLAVDGNHVFVADGGGGLRIIDVQSPAAPVETGSYTAAGQVTAVAIDGDYAFVADDNLGLIVLDVSNPASPTPIGSAAPSAGIVDLAVAGDFVFAAGSLSGLEVYDVSDPSAPALVGTLSPGGVWSVAVQGDAACISTATNFIVVDVSNPAAPFQVGSLSTAPNTIVDIALDGFNAYAADGYGGLLVLDIIDPTAPRVLHDVPMTEPVTGVANAGEHAFLANAADGLRVVDVTELSPPIAGGTTAAGSALDMFIAGRLAFVAAGGSGVKIIDMSDPLNPDVVGSYASAGVARGIVVAGNVAYVASDTSGLVVLDVSDPSNPAEIGSYDTPNTAYDVVIAGNRAFVADSAAVRVLDITDPANPVQVGVEPAPSAALGAALSGNYLYIAEGHAGLGVIDVADPSTPALVGAWDSPGYTENLAVDGDYVYMADLFGGLQIVDISTPNAPVPAGSYASSFLATDVAVTGNFAIIATGATSAKVVDITNPASPVLINNMATGLTTQRLRIAGDHLYVGSNSSFGLVKIFENRVRFADDAARSVAVDGGDDPIVRARLISTQVDSIRWELSGDGGTSWLDASPDGTFYRFATLGNDLIWRAELARTPSIEGTPPLCSLLEIDWRYEFSVVNGVSDVPNDEGGFVDVNFTRSGYDFTDELSVPVIGYNIHLRIDDAALAQRVAAAGREITGDTPQNRASGRDGPLPFVESAPGTRTYELDGRYYTVSNRAAGTAPPGVWEIVGSVFATRTDTYSLAVPSRGDSSAVIPYSVFYVSTHTSVPGLYFDSPVDSGYSVDNLPPAPPVNLAAAYNSSGGTSLTWDPSPEPDWQYYRIYRGTDPGFGPDSQNLVQSTGDPFWTDPIPEGWRYYYKITSLDDSGNESDPASPTTITSVADDTPAPERFALYRNVPNPFNPSTTVAYDVAKTGGHVRLAIYDVGGRLVRVLADEFQTAGAKRVVWNGRDDRGAPVASGVYFLKMNAPGFERTLKMSLIQ